MIENGVINRYQLWLLVINFHLGSALLFFPGKIAAESKQNGWIAILLVTLIGSLLILLTVTLVSRNNNQTIVKISESLLGKPIGFLVGLFYAWFYIHLTAILLREIEEMIISTILNETPEIVIYIMITSLVFWVTYHGIEIIARTTEIFAPIAFLGLLLTVILVIPLMQLENLLPIMAEGIKPIIKGSYDVLGFTFAEISIFFMIIPFVNNHKILLKTTISAGIVAGLLLTVMVVVSIMVLGVNTTAMSIFAPLNVARLIDIGHFLQRIELLMYSTYLVTMLVKLTLSFYAGVIAMAQTFHLSDYRANITPLIIIVITLSPALGESIIEFFDASRFWTPYTLVLSLVIPLLLLGISYMKGKK